MHFSVSRPVKFSTHVRAFNRHLRHASLLHRSQVRSVASTTKQAAAPKSKKLVLSQDLPPQVVITDSAKKRLREIAVEDTTKGTPLSYLRLAVDPGGCNGLLAKFSMEETPLHKDDKIVFDDKTGAKMVIDDISLKLLNGSTIDYSSELARSAFVLKEIPQATSMCGCKVSFNVEL